MIPVTKSFLPPIEEYTALLEKVWTSKWVTNRGALVLELESKLRQYLGVKELLITNNGTIPIQLAMKLAGNCGEVITTPFSYVATTSSIVWEHCKPVYVDIDPDHLTIDETKIEAAITHKTTAILATHVFGNPCHAEVIQDIANRHGIKVIYDGAHSFGVNYLNQSVFNYGDITTCSFHATKLFHTGEGGALFCSDPELFHRLYYSHNFGHNGPLDFHGLGINGKISELQAAMGLAVFTHLPTIIEERKRITEYYDAHLNFERLTRLKIRAGTEWNYSYYPVIFESEDQLLRIEQNLKANDIVPRRYFYPSLNTIPYAQGAPMPISESIASRILCLPLYVGLSESESELICKTINNSL